MLLPLPSCLASGASIEDIPEESGVYAITLRSTPPSLQKLLPQARRPFTAVALYIGCTSTLRTRLCRHLSGEAAVSTMRKSLLAMELSAGALSGEAAAWPLDEAEEHLTAWLRKSVTVSWQQASSPQALELKAITATEPLLNIALAPPSPWRSQLLAARRSVFGRHVGLEGVLAARRANAEQSHVGR